MDWLHARDEDDWVEYGNDDSDGMEETVAWLKRWLAYSSVVFVVSMFITPVATYIWSFLHYAVPAL